METCQADERRVVLGMGTGRCGTHALAQLLNQQPDAHVTHEQPPLLPWKALGPRSQALLGNATPGSSASRKSKQSFANIGSQAEPGNQRQPIRLAAEESLIRARLGRFRQERSERLIGDVASFYLPYVEAAIEAEPGTRIICLKRPREEVVASFCRWLDTVHPLPMNHWSATGSWSRRRDSAATLPSGPNKAAAGTSRHRRAERPHPQPHSQGERGVMWHHDPIWTRIFPQYDIQDREEGLRRYWDDYYRAVETLVGRFPEQIRVFSMDEALNTVNGQRALLSFAGILEDRQVLAVGHRTNQPEQVWAHPRREIVAASDPRDPRRCAVLVPYTTHIVPDCETSLKELEQRGYPVRRVRGYAAIDQGRNQMATDVLIQGFEETMWIDADIGFDPDAVERLRSHGEAIVCGIYPQKGRRALACHLLPGTSQLIFGEGGGLQEILYAGTGFLLVRREVYSHMQRQLELPVCNERFGRPTIPFFQPMVRSSDDGWWYLAEDYSFCERARQCGYRILADTTIRLWHVGQYAYSWEDAGIDRERYGTFAYHLE